MKSYLPLTFGLAALFSPSVARADPPIHGPAIAIGGGFEAFPILIGSGLFVTADLEPARWLGFSASAGGNVFGPVGILTARVQVPIGRRVGLGVEGGFEVARLKWDSGTSTNGVSLGANDDVGSFDDDRIDLAVYGRFGVAVRVDESQFFRIIGHVGATSLLDRGACYVVANGAEATTPSRCYLDNITPWLPYVGATFAYAVDL